MLHTSVHKKGQRFKGMWGISIDSSTFWDWDDIFDSNDKQFSIVELPTKQGVVFVVRIRTEFNDSIIFL